VFVWMVIEEHVATGVRHLILTQKHPYNVERGFPCGWNVLRVSGYAKLC
jgi:hypothetical protein